VAADALDSAALASLARRHIEAGLRHMAQRMTVLQTTYAADKPLVSLCKTITRACKAALHSACHREYKAAALAGQCHLDAATPATSTGESERNVEHRARNEQSKPSGGSSSSGSARIVGGGSCRHLLR